MGQQTLLMKDYNYKVSQKAYTCNSLPLHVGVLMKNVKLYTHQAIQMHFKSP